MRMDNNACTQITKLNANRYLLCACNLFHTSVCFKNKKLLAQRSVCVHEPTVVRAKWYRNILQNQDACAFVFTALGVYDECDACNRKRLKTLLILFQTQTSKVQEASKSEFWEVLMEDEIEAL